MQALLHPRSVALIGASPDPNKLNGRPFHYLRRDGYEGAIYPVNPKYDNIDGVPCYKDIASLPEAPDLAVIMVSARLVDDIVMALGERGTPVALVVSSGYSETGAEGRQKEQRLIETARAHGVRICGPNNLGLISAFDRMAATFSQYAFEPPLAGPIAFASQSGALGTGIAYLARSRNLGFGYFVTTGNQADITIMEVLERIVDDGRISVLSAYIEGLRPGDGASLVHLASRAMQAGKPLIVTKVGRNKTGARAAQSHTGSLAGEDRVFDGVLRQHHVIRARHEEHMLDLMSVLSRCPVPEGRGVAIITQSGGSGVLMADRADELELDVPILAPATQDKLTAVLPHFAATANPVDVTGQFLADPNMLSDSIKIVLDDPEIHICVVWLQLMGQYAATLVDLFKELRESIDKPLIICWVGAPESAVHALNEAGICLLETTERAIEAAAGLARFGEMRRRYADHKPAVAPPVVEEAKACGNAEPVNSLAAAAALMAYGLPIVESALAKSPDDAKRLASQLGFPVALKIESADLPHKTEAGGVRLGIADEDAVALSGEEILSAARVYAPDARVDGLLVQKMVEPGVQLVLGLRQDPVFGPVIMAGIGGIFVEILDDVVFARAPVTPDEAKRMLGRLKARAMFDGVRGAPPVDLEAIIQLLCNLSDFALAHPQVAELDLNPVFAGPDGAVIVDWLMLANNGSLNALRPDEQKIA